MNGRDDPRSVLKRAMGLENNDEVKGGIMSRVEWICFLAVLDMIKRIQQSGPSLFMMEDISLSSQFLTSPLNVYLFLIYVHTRAQRFHLCTNVKGLKPFHIYVYFVITISTFHLHILMKYIIF